MALITPTADLQAHSQLCSSTANYCTLYQLCITDHNSTAQVYVHRTVLLVPDLAIVFPWWHMSICGIAALAHQPWDGRIKREVCADKEIIQLQKQQESQERKCFTRRQKHTLQLTAVMVQWRGAAHSHRIHSHPYINNIICTRWHLVNFDTWFRFF